MKIIGLLGHAGAGKDTVAAMIAPIHLVRLDGEVVDIRAQLADDVGASVPALCPRGIQIGLADPLKEFCRSVYDFSLMQLWGPSEERNAPDTRYPREYREHLRVDGVGCARCASPSDDTCYSYLTPREALQQLGTEWGRTCWPSTWVRLALSRIAKFAERPPERPVHAHVFAHSWIIPRADVAVISDCRFVDEVAILREHGHAVWRIERDVRANGALFQHASEREQEADEIGHYVTHTINNNGTLASLRSQVREALASVKEPHDQVHAHQRPSPHQNGRREGLHPRTRHR